MGKGEERGGVEECIVERVVMCRWHVSRQICKHVQYYNLLDITRDYWGLLEDYWGLLEITGDYKRITYTLLGLNRCWHNL